LACLLEKHLFQVEPALSNIAGSDEAVLREILNRSANVSISLGLGKKFFGILLMV